MQKKLNMSIGSGGLAFSLRHMGSATALRPVGRNALLSQPPELTAEKANAMGELEEWS
ncbi:MAG: hypothetical protein OXI01_02260 [Albidovulum sp.]|nr:hypothetical protein [Albidovulum sp.]